MIQQDIFWEHWGAMAAEARKRYKVEPCLATSDGEEQGLCQESRCPDCVGPDWPRGAVPTFECSACGHAHCADCARCAELRVESDLVALAEVDEERGRIDRALEEAKRAASRPNIPPAEVQRVVDYAFNALGGGEEGLESATDNPALMAAVDADGGDAYASLLVAMRFLEARLAALDAISERIQKALRAHRLAWAVLDPCDEGWERDRARRSLPGLRSRPHRRRRRSQRVARTSARSRGDGHACASSGRWAVPDFLPA